jgi:pilus assembly protein CpaF
VTEELDSLFGEHRGAAQMWAMLRDPNVSQVTVNRYDRIFFIDNSGVQSARNVFAGTHDYVEWLNTLLKLTDVGYEDVASANTSVIEGSFDAARTDLHGSIHIATKELTRGDPALTVRKQPHDAITLDALLIQGMMSPDMYEFLKLAVQGRLNLLISGGSGAGKTTMARALSYYIAPEQRVVTVEEIDELHLQDRLPNVVSLTTHRERDTDGRSIREVELEDLVREALRMRADRIWVGETRGKEAFALVKACNSGHDGSITTIHADDAKTAVRQAVTYVMEGGVAEEVARDQVAQAFHLVIQIAKVSMGRRVITEITELEAVREGPEQRRNPLYQYDRETGAFMNVGQPTRRITQAMQRYGVSFDQPVGVAPARR